MEHAVHMRAELLGLSERIRELPLVLVAAPAGSGKSSLLSAWAERLEEHEVATARIDLAPLHEDMTAFLEELVLAIRHAAPLEPGSEGFGATLLRRLPHLEDADPHVLVRLLADEVRELAESIVVFLDDYHRLPPDSPVDRLIGRGLRDGIPSLHLVVSTRGAAPRVAARLLAEGRALALGPDDLSLRADQVQRVLADRGVELSEDLLSLLLARTEGWATGVLLAARAIGEGRTDDIARFVAELAHDEDLFSYVAAELLADEPRDVLGLLENAALLGPAERRVLERLIGPGAPQLVDDALGRGLLLRQGRRVGLHQLWTTLLRERMRRRLDPTELTRAVADAADALEQTGEPDRAIELCIDLDQPDLGIGLLERHGLDWTERGHYDTVARWLSALAPDSPARDESAELSLVRGLVDGRRDVPRAVEALEAAADQLRARGDLDRELAARHNALILAANENLDDRARRAALAIVRPRRLLQSHEARSTALLFMAVGALLSGRYRIARRLLERVARHAFPPRERGALTIARAQIALASGDWQHAAALTEESLSDPAQREHGPSYFAARTMRAFARGVLRRDVDDSLNQLAEANDAFRDFRLAVSEAEGRVFAALLLTREGREARALEELERARHLYDELCSNEGRANLAAVLARVHHRLGNTEAARHQAATALRIYGHTRQLRRRPWSGALAAWVAAESGDVEAAVAFVSGQLRRLDAPALAASQHATHLALARIAELSGDEASCAAHLRRAHEAAGAADLALPIPDVDESLLGWALGAARARGFDTRTAERFTRTPPGTAVRDHPLRIFTFGTFRVERDGAPVDARAWQGLNPQRLFQRLLVEGGRPVSRERLGVEFWPEATPAKARGSLRTALRRLRRVLEPSRGAGDPERWLAVDGEAIGVHAETIAAWDVTAWRGILERASRESGEVALELRCRAVREYAPFLPDTLDDWALDLRRELEERFVRTGREAIRELLERDRHAEAAEVASRLIAEDPADESAWCAKIRAEVARGERRSAERTLAEAVDALRRELEADPGPELRALASSLARTS